MREVYGMKLIFCIDDKSGMMFFGKRQSQDQNLREWIGFVLLKSKYIQSIPLFPLLQEESRPF